MSVGASYPVSARRNVVTRTPAPAPPRTNFLLSLTYDLIQDDTAILVKFIPATGFGNSWFSIYLNGIHQTSVFAAEGTMSQQVIESNNGKNSIAVLWTGEQQLVRQPSAVAETEKTGQKVTLAWNWVYDIIGNPASELSNWTLSGLTREWTEPGGVLTRRQLQIASDETGGTVAITGTRNGLEVFSGSAAQGATATLTQSNGSGISGTVDVGATAADADETLHLRLPSSMEIFRDTSSSPTTSVASVGYNESDVASYVETSALASATYYYRMRATSDTADVGDYGTDVTIDVPGTPDAPEDLAYSSGNAAATVLSFTASDTVGATYNLYMAAIGATILPVQTPVATAIAGSTTITMPAVTGYAGSVRVLLRAESVGIEEKNGNELVLEYDAAGAFVVARPNTPEVTLDTVTTGTTISMAVTYDSTNELGVGVTAQLFTRVPTGTFDFTTVEDSDALAGTGTIKTGTLAVTLANGWHYVTSKVATAGGIQSAVEAQEQLVYVSDTNISSPAPSVKLSGG